MPEFDSTIEYRDIPGFAGYKICSDGSVWSCWSRGHNTSMTTEWNRLKGGIAKGHNYVWLFPERRKREFRYVCHIVLEVFVCERPAGMEACHGEKGNLDDSVGNLRWDTRLENMRDKKRHGTQVYGERTKSTTLTESDVRRLRSRRNDGLTYRELGIEFGIVESAAWAIVKRKTWPHVT